MGALLGLRRLLGRGRGVSIAVTGEAGVGKSFTLERFLQTLPCRVIRVNADWPLAQVVKAVPSSVRENDWVATLCARALRGDTGVSTAQLASALATRLEALAPVVLVVDQFHRAASEQVAFWEALGHEVRRSRSVGLVALSRRTVPAEFEVQEVVPLDREGLEELLGGLGAVLPDSFVDWMERRTGGNPFLTLELLRHLERVQAVRVEDGMLYFSPTKAETLPTTLVALVRSLLPTKIDAETENELIRILLSTEAAGATQWPLGGARAILENAGILRGGQLHPLYREALLSALSPVRVVDCLRALAEECGSIDPMLAVRVLDDLADFTPIPKELSYQLLSRAAAEALTLGRRSQGAEFWKQAAQQAAPGSPERAKAWWAASQVLAQLGTGATAQARELSLAALREVPPGTLELSLDDWHNLLNRQAAAGGTLAELESLWPPEYSADLKQHWLYCFLNLLVQNNDVAKLLAYWESLSAEQQRDAPGEALLGVGGALIRQERNNEAKLVLMLALERLKNPVDRLGAKFNLVSTDCALMSPAEEIKIYDELLAEARLIREPQYAFKLWQLTSAIRFNRLIPLGQTGQWEQCISEGAELGQEFLENGNLLAYIVSLRNNSSQLHRMGRFEEARKAIEKAELGCRKMDISLRIDVKFGLVTLYFDWNTPQAPSQLAHIVAELSQLLSAVPASSHIRARLALSKGLAACGQVDLALSMVQELEEIAKSNGNTDSLPNLMFVRALCANECGQSQQAAELQQRAVELAEQYCDLNEIAIHSLWAAHFANNELELERWTAFLTERGQHGPVHSVMSRRQEVVHNTTPTAQILVLGDIQLYQSNGQPFNSRPAAHLLTLLLCARMTGEDGLSMTEVAEELFPERDEPNALRALRRLLTRLRDVLGQGVVRQSGERLLLGEIQSDAELFLQTQEPELWRGLFLNDDLGGEFTDGARTLLLTRLEGLVGVLLDTDPESAERLAALLCRHEPYEQRLLSLQLRAHDAANHPRQAGAAYRKAREHYAEVGETLPEDWQTFLAKESGTAAMPALVALSSGPAQGTVSAARQARALQVHRSTISRWQKGEIQRPGERGRPAKLSDEQLDRLREVIGQPPKQAGIQAQSWTLAVIADYVDQSYGVRLSRSQLSRLLRQ